MTKKKLEMTRNQLKQIGSTTTHPKLSELQSSLEPVRLLFSFSTAQGTEGTHSGVMRYDD